MPKTRQQKEQTVIELKDKLTKAKLVAFTDYRGLTMSQLSDLRTKLRDVQGEFTITKNNLLKIAISDKSESSQKFNGPVATLFSYDDEISPLKVLVKTLKDAGVGKVKGGFLGTEALDETRMIQLSTLPTKDELRGKTVGVLVAPLQGMVGVLQGNLRNLVYALSEIKKVKGGGV
jgi:large subunit ribosomal protein L10